MGLLKAYKRLRHSRGYGVHSPSAYSLVREVIRPSRGYEYYAERRLPQLRGAIKAALLYRIAVYLQPSTVCITGTPDLTAAATAIIGEACPGVKVTGDGKADLLVCFGREGVGTEWGHGIFSDRRNPSLKTAADRRRTGHLLRSRRAALLINVNVPFQVTDISF